MIPVLSAVLVASLVGSLHCVGMCGGLVAFAAGSAPPGRRAMAHIAYHGSRGTAYLLLGGISGTLGAAVDLGGGVLGVSRLAAVLAGVGMVLFGAVALARARGVQLRWLREAERRITGGRVQRWVQAGIQLATGQSPLRRALLVGTVSAVLPCGWLYAFVISAAGAGSPAAGAAVMAAFWLGTVPALLGVGLGAQLVAGRLQRHLPTATAVLLMLVGVAALAGRITMPAMQGHQPPGTMPDASAPCPCEH
jgi:sulfite exporter TauE/SafE